ncbi:MAG: hypothetical protein ACXWKP_31895 [Bradyrhizobium sp.]
MLFSIFNLAGQGGAGEKGPIWRTLQVFSAHTLAGGVKQSEGAEFFEGFDRAAERRFELRNDDAEVI